jgi:non-canonical (house-cleaning) NTP pyrophosphatase
MLKGVKYDEIIIVDDLVQSGGTLIECKNALESIGYKNISAYVTHSVFPNNSWKKIISSGFYRFYTTNSIPDSVDKFDKISDSPFVVLKLFGEQSYNSKKIFVSSHNIQKLQAAWNIGSRMYKDKHLEVNGINVESEIPSQPIGHEETCLGSQNRLNNLIKYLDVNSIKWDTCLSFENGVVVESICETTKVKIYNDICYLTLKHYGTSPSEIEISSSKDLVIIPEDLVNICIQNNQTKTIGEIIQEQLGIPKKSFHESFNEQKKTRVDIMSSINTMAIFGI